MSKPTNAMASLHAEMQKKFMRIPHANKGDHASLKSKESTVSKTPVYVHQFNRTSSKNLPANQNVYQNGFQGYFEEKTNFLKSKFDALSLENKPNTQSNVPNIKYTIKNLNYNKCPVHQSRVNMKMKGLDVVDKSVIQKLEENYWSNWKPNNVKKQQNNQGNSRRSSIDKSLLNKCASKLLPTVKPSSEKLPSQNSLVKVIHKTSDAYESKSSEHVLNVIAPQLQLDQNSSVASVENNINIGDNSSNVLSKKLSQIEEKLSKTITPHLSTSEESGSDGVVFNKIKHTDSLLLTTRKQQKEKEHYQQPKCIRLKQKDVGVVVRSSRNYVKGGSYPLKSCLRSDKEEKKGSLQLGKPGGSLVLCRDKKGPHKKLRKKV